MLPSSELNLQHLAFAYKSTCVQLAEINECKCAADDCLQFFFHGWKAFFTAGSRRELLPSALELLNWVSGNKVAIATLCTLLSRRKEEILYYTSTGLSLNSPSSIWICDCQYTCGLNTCLQPGCSWLLDCLCWSSLQIPLHPEENSDFPLCSLLMNRAVE